MADYILDKNVAIELGVKSAFILSVTEQKGTTDLNKIADVADGIMSEFTVRRCLEKLKKHGYIADNKLDLAPEKIKQMVLEGEKTETCEWCNQKVYLLQEHHYPVPRRKGGKEIVKICPNCHVSFHNIEVKNNGGWYEVGER